MQMTNMCSNNFLIEALKKILEPSRVEYKKQKLPSDAYTV